MNTDSLKALHTALVDNTKGYVEAAKDAEPSTVGLFKDMVALHGRDHEEIHAALVASGEKPDDSGSFVSIVRETVVKVRSAVTGLGTNSLSAFASGEEMLLNKYDDAIEEAGNETGRLSMLQRQKKVLAAKIELMKAAAT